MTTDHQREGTTMTANTTPARESGIYLICCRLGDLDEPVLDAPPRPDRPADYYNNCPVCLAVAAFYIEPDSHDTWCDHGDDEVPPPGWAPSPAAVAWEKDMSTCPYCGAPEDDHMVPDGTYSVGGDPWFTYQLCEQGKARRSARR
jgi:hypothetical protein